MKQNIYFIAFLSLFLIPSLQAQNYDKRSTRADLEAQKIAYITSELSLTPKESQAFWPLYNAYRNDLQNLRKSGKINQGERISSQKQLSEDELDAQVKQEFANDRKKIDLDEKYYELYKTALPIDKVVAFYQAEHDFKKELLKALKDRR